MSIVDKLFKWCTLATARRRNAPLSDVLQEVTGKKCTICLAFGLLLLFNMTFFARRSILYTAFSPELRLSRRGLGLARPLDRSAGITVRPNWEYCRRRLGHYSKRYSRRCMRAMTFMWGRGRSWSSRLTEIARTAVTNSVVDRKTRARIREGMLTSSCNNTLCRKRCSQSVRTVLCRRAF